MHRSISHLVKSLVLREVRPAIQSSFPCSWRWQSSRSRRNSRVLERQSPKRFSPAVDVDGYVNDLHLQYKIKSDAKLKFEENLRRKQTTRRQSVSSEVGSVTASLEKPDAPRTIDSTYTDTICAELETADNEGKAISSGLLVRYASMLCRSGNTKGIELCQKIMAEHDEDSFEEFMHLDHYLANALWFAGRLEEATKILKRLYHDHPLQRKKIKDIFRFCILRSLNRYPCEEDIKYINDFLSSCADLMELQPIVLYWSALFEHAVPAANEDAYRLVEKYPQIKLLLHFQFDGLLKRARERQDSNLLWRFLELIRDPGIFVEAQDLHHWCGCIFDALMDIACAHEDLEAAEEIVSVARRTAMETNGLLWPEMIRKFQRLQKLRRSGADEPTLIKLDKQPLAKNPFANVKF